MPVNIDCPREMTSSCADQILSDEQHSKIRVWKCMLKQERCLKILESVLQDCVDQWQLEGEHDIHCLWDIDKVCLAGPDKRCSLNVSTNRLTTTPSQGCNNSILRGGTDGCPCYGGPGRSNWINPTWPLKTGD